MRETSSGVAVEAFSPPAVHLDPLYWTDYG